MQTEEKIKTELVNKFNYLTDKINISRPRRIFVDVDYANFKEVFDYIVKKLDFSCLCTITGVDNLNSFGVIYHLSLPDKGIVLNLKANIDRDNPVLKSVTGYFSGAEIYERELEDMFGFKVEGLKPGNRYPLPDDWPANDHPLRKDWKNKEVPKAGGENA